MHDIELKSIQLGNPTKYAFAQRFNGSYRIDIHNKYIYENINQVR
jgi:hypothetical protein